MSLPPELNSLINKKKGFSILIKGPAGVGKTLLTLEMLLNASKGMYVSSRISPHALFDHIPDFEEKLSKIKVIDASQALIPTVATPEDSKQAIFKAIKYHDLPDFITHLIGEIETFSKTEKGSLLVAIDSWEAILESKKQDNFVTQSGQKRVEALLSDIIKITNVNLILVAEHAAPTFLDYLVDVILDLHLDYMDGQPIRTLEIKKLRGTDIVQNKYLYSLKSGRFTYFDKFEFKLPEIMLRPKPIKDPRAQLLSTGSHNFDKILDNGIKYGSWILFEVGDGIGDGFYQLIIPLIVNHLNLDRDLLTILPEGTNIYQFEKLHSGFVPDEKFKDHVVVFEMFSGYNLKETVKSQVQEIDKDPEEMFDKIHKELLEKGNDIEKPPFLVVGLDTLELLYPEKEFLKALVTNISFTKNFLNVTVALAKEEQECVKTLSHLCSMHWKLELVHQSLLLRGIQPITGYYGITVDLSEGFIDLQFTPIV
ncbi:MAG: RAD55 family ATPase [Candidatus Hodarchaeota archaeon]